MTRKTKLSLMLMALSALLGLPEKTLAQLEEAYSRPNNPPKVELVASN